MAESIYQNSVQQSLKLIIKGLIHSFRFGTRTRIPHGFVNKFLVNYDTGELTKKLQFIFDTTWEHSVLLAKWVTLYKFLLWIFRSLEKKSDSQWHHLVAGFIGGWYVFGAQKTGVTTQINLYVFSRVFMGLWRILHEKKYLPEGPKGNGWRLFSAFTWAIVMWQFAFYKSNISKGMGSAMNFLYVESNIS